MFIKHNFLNYFDSIKIIATWVPKKLGSVKYYPGAVAENGADNYACWSCAVVHWMIQIIMNQTAKNKSTDRTVSDNNVIDQIHTVAGKFIIG